MIKTLDGILLEYVLAFYSEFTAKMIDGAFDYNIKIEKIDIEAISQLNVNLIINSIFNNYLEQHLSKSHDLIPGEII
ncbi:hypothetical protein [Bacillus sp. FJAT-50079]|uniref:hypothetical protein n=1 Tax=Bacillus sp. FJAT-50079 TaxID=2833577 RepID=UPI001BC95275|nr:hypothetical protein [Bacillus sp. FJAT-50079]MBS4207204.1 hypothetical protein [Bacillus sp. FJAT-50079]